MNYAHLPAVVLISTVHSTICFHAFCVTLSGYLHISTCLFAGLFNLMNLNIIDYIQKFWIYPYFSDYCQNYSEYS
jgi:hypothetical protein